MNKLPIFRSTAFIFWEQRRINPVTAVANMTQENMCVNQFIAIFRPFVFKILCGTWGRGSQPAIKIVPNGKNEETRIGFYRVVNSRQLENEAQKNALSFVPGPIIDAVTDALPAFFTARQSGSSAR